MNKQTFRKWLEKNTDLGESTIKKYASRVDSFTKADRAKAFNIQAFDIYNPMNQDFIWEIENSEIFKQINKKQHRDYSAALTHFKKYQKMMMANDDGDYMSIGREPAIKPNIVKDTPQKISAQVINETTQFVRNKKVSIQSLANADYSCEFDTSHQSFISRFTGKMYVEAHHLIPLSNQHQFKYSLDVPANIVSLCPNCHKTVHYGDEEQVLKITNYLLTSRKSRLSSSNIDVDSTRLKTFYI
ncbi:HNH endonuclease [Weissella confusa]|uniref:HNH endonuclease n=1 Tax=Weissella confusa TaxID=1583 RepID=UPI0021A75E9F|nr:HNH endonuclease [Weissella confusa]MCT2910521.1 hypothetical protein [Weissella confusa]